VLIGIAGTQFSHSTVELDVLAGNVSIELKEVHSNNVPEVSAVFRKALLLDGSITGITGIFIALTSGSFPVGTAVRVEGWDA
jgi:hypothetical protein